MQTVSSPQAGQRVRVRQRQCGVEEVVAPPHPGDATLARLSSLDDGLAESRKYQGLVATQLADQVLDALYELLRGFQAADDARRGDLLREALQRDPDRVYAGLLTVLMRLVFLLYAEDRGLMASDPVSVNSVALAGLFERLRADAGQHADTMDLRSGAWAQLLSLFRLVHDGGRLGALRIPARRGDLFDPDRYPFLEGRPPGDRLEPGTRIDPPRVSDGVVFRVLRDLLVLDGERLSYRTLDVEQLGSVYEAMMGFHLEVARGPSIAVKAAKPHGAPTTIDLAALLAVAPEHRAKRLKEQADHAPSGASLRALKASVTPEDIVAALGRKIAHEATPAVVPAGAMILQPSDERRRSGSHYTPRSLTEPIVRTTLRPILEALGARPSPEQILELKVCDPAMGSGAFLVEACRQLAEELVKSWHAHDCIPAIPPDVDELLHARRIVARSCLYGVDKDPMAVDLAKLSLWLATLAQEHPFTFLDHALRCGDSLVGLSRTQIVGFHWKPERRRDFVRRNLAERIRRAITHRREIRWAAELAAEALLRQELELAEDAINPLRSYGDLVVSAFFAGSDDRRRKARLDELAEQLAASLQDPHRLDLREPLDRALAALVTGEKPVEPFHWEVEFPEVFDRANPGFDAIVGNPPFAGKNTLAAANAAGYPDWLKQIHEESHGNSDLVAHFFRRAFSLLRRDGTFGLIATKTIGQGDTRATGLRWICTHHGTIYSARKRIKWPGPAAVVVSVVHVRKGAMPGPCELDRRPVPRITAYLFHAGGHEDPRPLKENANKSFQGSIVLGMGFTFDDTDTKGVANPISTMHDLIAKDPRNADRIYPFIGWEEVANSPGHQHHRFAIDLGDPAESEARAEWPDLMAVLEEKVKRGRERSKDASNATSRKRAERWWVHGSRASELYEGIRHGARVLVTASQAMTQYAFAFLPNGMVYSSNLTVIATGKSAAFCVVQSRVHEIWVRRYTSTLKDDLAYAPSDCFETFPFPEGFEVAPRLEDAGRAYDESRAALMVRNNEGLTRTYNRFHDPDERSADIVRLRALHAAMDRAVLDAYGWTDLEPSCEFLLDYEDEEESEEGSGRRRKKPWRYRWPDEVRDEVLSRLLALNGERARAEAPAVAAAPTPKKKDGRKPAQGQMGLPGGA